jgi:predicted trehalose synthase
METLLSSEAAARLGVNVQKFHRLVAEHKIAPAFEAPGLRGAKFWLPRDVERLAELTAMKAAKPARRKAAA